MDHVTLLRWSKRYKGNERNHDNFLIGAAAGGLKPLRQKLTRKGCRPVR
jgi:hypothetical protein